MDKIERVTIRILASPRSRIGQVTQEDPRDAGKRQAEKGEQKA